MESQITIILISILFSSFFSGMEIAYVSTNKIFVEIEKKQKGINSYFIKKITNNPSKVATMNKFNINVAERIPLKVGQNKNNLRYLETKAKKSGHLL